MKNYEVTYSKGHLVDKKSGKRIYLKGGGTFFLLGEDDQFVEKDELQRLQTPLTSKEKFTALKEKYHGYYLEKIADKGSEFVFRIGLSLETSEDKSREFVFNAILHEDLYMISKNGNEWGLSPSLCESNECLHGDVQIIEPVPGESLSNLFANVVTFYFAFQRSTACNAFTTFFLKSIAQPTLEMIKGKYLKSLDDLRNQVIDKYSKMSKEQGIQY